MDDPHAKLVQALTVVRKRFDEDADDWQHSLLRTYREYSLAIGIDRRLLHPLQKLLFEVDNLILNERRRKSGKQGTPMPRDKASALTFAAAAVTLMKKRGDYATVEQAERAVAHAAGIERKTIKTFRDNLNRGKAPELATKAYQDILKKMKTWPTQALLKESLPGLGRFVT